MVNLILLVFAFVLFTLATFNIPSKWNLVAAGLAFWVLSLLVSGGSAFVK